MFVNNLGDASQQAAIEAEHAANMAARDVALRAMGLVPYGDNGAYATPAEVAAYNTQAPIQQAIYAENIAQSANNGASFGPGAAPTIAPTPIITASPAVTVKSTPDTTKVNAMTPAQNASISTIWNQFLSGSVSLAQIKAAMVKTGVVAQDIANATNTPIASILSMLNSVPNAPIITANAPVPMSSASSVSPIILGAAAVAAYFLLA